MGQQVLQHRTSGMPPVEILQNCQHGGIMDTDLLQVGSQQLRLVPTLHLPNGDMESADSAAGIAPEMSEQMTTMPVELAGEGQALKNRSHDQEREIQFHDLSMNCQIDRAVEEVVG